MSLNRILVCIAALIAGCDGNLYSRTSVRFTASVVDDDEHPETFGSGVLFADQLPERFTEVTIGRRECVPYDEAHLHPQLQARFMQIMSERVASNHPLQVILTTHSPQLAAQAKLEDVCMMVGGRAFALSFNETKLEPGDYEFLRRFLDATKANLLFARGVLIVEGDAENLLLPAIAEKLGRSFSANGVSVVNVGHVGLFRYSRILRRNNAPSLGPVWWS